MRPMNGNMNGSWYPTNSQVQHSLKMNKESHMIKKPSSTTSSSSSSSSFASSLSHGNRAAASSSSPPPKPQQRHPVIIYTHSPKVIHTQPKDFMSLVQKLTGMSHTNLEGDKKKTNKSPITTYCQDPNKGGGDKGSDYMKVFGEENESSLTSEDGCNNGGDNGQVNSNCLGSPSMAFHHPHNSFMGLPLYPPGGSTNSYNKNKDLLCLNNSSSSSTTDDPTYDFIDFNVPFN